MALAFTIGVIIFVIVLVLIFALAKTVMKIIAGVVIFLLIIAAIFGLMCFKDYTTIKNIETKQFVLMDDDDLIFGVQLGDDDMFLDEVELSKEKFSIIADIEIFEELPDVIYFDEFELTKTEFLDYLKSDNIEGFDESDEKVKAMLFIVGIKTLMEDKQTEMLIKAFKQKKLKVHPKLWTLTVGKYLPMKLYEKVLDKLPI